MVPPQARGQAANSGASSANQGISALPQQLLSTNFTLPSHSINWPAYHQWEECYAAYNRMRALAKYHAFLPGMSPNRSTDTLHWSEAFPIDSSVVQLPRACLQRFRWTDVPPLALPKLRKLASDVNADSLFQAIVTQQLAVLPTDAVQQRAELLGSVILELLDRSDNVDGDRISSPSHVRMVHAYMDQLDRLGPTVWKKRIQARDWLIDYAARQTYDLDAHLTLLQEERQIVQQPAVQHLPEMQASSGLPDMTMGGMRILEVDQKILEVHYYQTLVRDSLTKLERPRDVVAKLGTIAGPWRWVNVKAPALHCDYYFATPQATLPQASSVPALPVPGQLSLVVFYKRGTYYLDDNVLTLLRRIHRDLPKLPMTFVGGTFGTFGTGSGDDVVEDPAREAVLLHHDIVDSLGFAGSLCVSKSQLTKTPEGHVLRASDVNTLAYYQPYGWAVYIVDPTGIVVGVHDEAINPDPGGLSGGVGFEWYLKRLAAKYGTAQPPSTNHTP